MKPKASPEPPQARDRREKKTSGVVSKSPEPPRLPSGLRPALRPPLPPTAMPPRPLPARRPEALEERRDLIADDSSETTLVESVSAQLVSASREESFDRDDPPTRETPIDVEAMLRAVSAQGLPSPVANEAPTLPPPPPDAPAAMPSMFSRPDPTPRMNQPLVPPPPPSRPVIARPTPSKPITPPQFPAMRPHGSTPSPPAAFAPLPELPLSLVASPSQPWRPGVPGPSSSSMPIAPPSTPSFVTGAPSSSRRPLDRAATGTFPLPHPVARRAYIGSLAPEPERSTWTRKVWLVFVAIFIAATIVGLAHLITGGTIWSP